MNAPDQSTPDVPMREFGRSLPMALLRAREAVMTAFRPSLLEHGITEQQWRVLRALAGAPAPMMSSHLGRETLLLGPSLTRIVANLVERGLVVQETDARDGRRVLLSISAAGLDLVRTIAPTSEAIYSWVEQRFGAQRMRDLTALLDDLARINDPLAGAPSSLPAGPDHPSGGNSP